uniref:Uncharacterized protein n=1 Tax=Curvibacter symbiont subsp. Hydra magnipapillata TaxID=667019 RepID=C9Y9E3_CURXX|nr:hypothetical protein Csp_A07440 [Curvibacter putative symbiont of Hydra magnipapillata]
MAGGFQLETCGAQHSKLKYAEGMTMYLVKTLYLDEFDKNIYIDIHCL